jgi:stage V sporulation protein K
VLDSLVNAEHIRTRITALQKRVKRQQREEGDPKKFLKNYVFVGAPGTGKTTIARAFGEIFHELGLLSSNVVVECKAMELIGEYVGHSAARMRYFFDTFIFHILVCLLAYN